MSLDAIGIVSGNVAKSVEFYALLGVKLTKSGDHDHYDATTPTGIRIMLDSVELIRTFDPTYQKPTASGVVLCFKQDSAAAVDALYARITTADPDGNQIDLFAPL